MDMKWRQIVLIIVVLTAGVAGGWWVFRPQPIGVDLATVGRNVLIVTVDDEGVAQIKDTYQISTPISGNVQRTPFRVGDHVENNAIVATITPPVSGFLDERTRTEAEASARGAEVAVTSAQTDIAAVQSELIFWEGEVERTDRLLGRGLTTQRAAEQARLELDRRTLMLTNAKASLEVRQQQLEQAQARLLAPNGGGHSANGYEIRSPIAGQVLAIDNESTRSLPAGAHLLTIGQPRNLEIIVDILSTDAVRIVAGAPAVISGWGRDIELGAEVRRIEPIGFTKVSALGIEEQRVRVHLDIKSDPDLWHSLGHLYGVFVRIQVEKVENAILVPSAALFRRNNEWSVFEYDAGFARLRTVRLGAQDSGFAEVIEGLQPDARVILHPNDRLAEGVLIIDRTSLQ